MKYLLVHQNFPGQFLHIARHLGASGAHEVVFITEGNAQTIPGVRKVAYRRPAPAAEPTHIAAREFDLAARRAEVVARTAATLKELGFQPDIVIGHHGWGELLNIRDVWPDVPLLGYFEFFYRTRGADVGFDPEFPTSVADHARIRAKNNVNLQALALDGHGQTPTQWQLSTYPAWARSQIDVLAEGVHLDICAPDPNAARQPLSIAGMTVAPGEKLVTYAARDLEPYRGFHVMMRAIPALLAARPDLRIAMVGGDGVSYGAAPRNTTWRAKLLKEIGKGFDPARVVFPGRVDYATHIKILQRSDAHVYLSYPFVASWSLREAMAVGCPLVGSDTSTVRDFLTHNRNGLLVPFHDPQRIADSVLRLLEDTRLSRRLRGNARKWAEANLAMPAYLLAYEALIRRVIKMT